MKNFVPKTLIESFLFNSPHHQIKRVQKMVPYPIKDVSNISDETYMDTFIYQVHCEYLTSNEFLHTRNKKMRLMTDNMFVQHMQNMMALRQDMRRQRKSDLENKLLSIIKKLNQNQNFIISCQEAEEMIVTMNAEQASTHKKYLIYIYKWILNQRTKGKTDYDQMREQLKKEVVNKIYDAHSKVQEKKIVQAELKKYERLAQARTCIAQGDLDQAKASYQQIFQDQTNDANVRMEALQYLCKNSQQKGDESYLLGMISKIKQQNGEERHRKYIQNVLSRLTNRSNESSIKNDSGQHKRE